MNGRPKALLCIVFTAALIFIAGCGNYFSSSVSTAPVAIKFWTTMSESESKALLPIIEEFQKNNPAIKVDVELVPFSSALNQFKVAALSKDAPDVFRSEIAWTSELADLDLLLAIDQRISASDNSDFLEAPYNYNKFEGKTYGVPQVTDAPALLYNKRLLTEAGVNVPTTMDEFLIAVKKLTKQGQYGFFINGDSYFLQPFIWAFGGGTITNQSEILINTPESLDGLEFFIKLKSAKVGQAAFDFQKQYQTMMDDFKEGKAAMIINGPWATSDILSGKEFKDPANLGIAPIPKGPKGQGSPVGGHNYVISKYSNHPDETYKFIEYINNTEVQVKLAKELRLLPTRKSAYDNEALKNDPIFQGFKAQMDVAKNRPVIPEGAQIFSDLTPNLELVLTDEITPEQMLDNVQEAWKKLLRQ